VTSSVTMSMILRKTTPERTFVCVPVCVSVDEEIQGSLAIPFPWANVMVNRPGLASAVPPSGVCPAWE